jgi:nitrite reductase/ring-hydroxylating ferredoxin subunit
VQNGDTACPLHGWNFDLRTGIPPYNPNDYIATHPVRLAGSQVELDAAEVPALPAAVFDVYQGRWRR